MPCKVGGGTGNINSNYYFAASYGGHSASNKIGAGAHSSNDGGGSGSKLHSSSSSKRIDKFKMMDPAGQAESMTPKQVMMMANLQSKGANKI